MTKTSNFSLSKYFIVLTGFTIGLPVIVGLLGVVTGGHNSPFALHVSVFMQDFGFLIGHVWALSVLVAAAIAIWRYASAPRK
jgi:thiosulfate reductase cytochrome b subunit